MAAIDIPFFWRCEGTTLDGTHDKTVGDSVATPNSTVAINAAAAIIGSNGLDSPSASDYYEFANANDIVPHTLPYELVLGRWVRATTWAAGAHLIDILNAATPNHHIRVSVSGSAGSGGIDVNVRVSGDATYTVSTGDIGLTTATDYFVKASLDTANTTIRIQVYDDTMTLVATATVDTGVTAAAFPNYADEDLDTARFGESSGTAMDTHGDNIFTSDVYAEPIEDSATITSFTEYGAPAEPSPDLVISQLAW